MQLLRAFNRRRLTKLFLKNGILEKLWRFFSIILLPWNLTSLEKQLPISRHRHTTPPLSAIAIAKARKEDKRNDSSNDLQKWENSLKLWNHMILLVNTGTKIVEFFSERTRANSIAVVTTWTWELVMKKKTIQFSKI